MPEHPKQYTSVKSNPSVEASGYLGTTVPFWVMYTNNRSPWLFFTYIPAILHWGQSNFFILLKMDSLVKCYFIIVFICMPINRMTFYKLFKSQLSANMNSRFSKTTSI